MAVGVGVSVDVATGVAVATVGVSVLVGVDVGSTNHGSALLENKRAITTKITRSMMTRTAVRY